jgi:TonB family protein
MLGLLLAVASFAATAAEPTAPKAPTGKWTVNFADNQCLASREFGTADQPLTLAIKAPVRGDVLQLAVLKGSRGPLSPQQLNGKLRLGDSPAKATSALVFSGMEGKRRIYLYNLASAEVAGWGGGGALALEAGGLNETLAVTGLAPLLKILRECADDLGKHWNYAGEGAPQKVRTGPRATLAHLFSSDDYPSAAYNQNQQGTVGVVLLVNEKGRVADCTLVQTSGIAVLDAQTCAIIQQRARYTPAVGLDGKPAKAVDSARIRWLMPI